MTADQQIETAAQAIVETAPVGRSGWRYRALDRARRAARARAASEAKAARSAGAW